MNDDVELRDKIAIEALKAIMAYEGVSKFLQMRARKEAA